ncbi:MAG: hypothetical protein IJP04_07920 [Clostridia bacterium]|nr:hypothetical protein [Clostridia bacterium]
MLKIYNGRKAFWQWDSGQKMLVTYEGPCDIHFKIPGEDVAISAPTYLLEGRTVADVPDQLLQVPGHLTAYIYICVGDKYTAIMEQFPIIPRQKPANYGQ